MMLAASGAELSFQTIFRAWEFEPQFQQARTSRDLETVGRDGGFGALNVWEDAVAEGLSPPLVLASKLGLRIEW